MKRSNVKVMPPFEGGSGPRPARELELELYRRIFNSANDAIAVVDANGYYLQQNPAHQRLIGYSDAELNGQTPAIHCGAEAFRQVAAELARTGRYNGELASHTKQGEKITIELSAFTMHDAEGHVLCHVGVKRDVSDRRRSNDELKARVRQQATVARLGQQALAGQELGGLMQDAVESVAQMVSTEFCKVLELLPDGKQLLLRAGCGWKDNMVGRATVGVDRDSHAGFTLRSTGPVVVEDLNTESRFMDASLREHRVVSGMSVIIPVRGRVWGVLGTHSRQRRRFTPEDVNFLVSVANVLAAAIERRQTEDVLQQSQQRLALAQRAANTATFDWDLISGFITWAGSTEAIYGVSSDDLSALAACTERIHPEDRGWVGERLQRALNERCEYDAEYRVLWPDGSTHWIAARGQVLAGAEGKTARMIGINMDVTARKRAEAALRESEERFRRAQRAANIGAYEWDVQSDRVQWSEELPVVRGLMPAGSFDNWMQRLHADDRARVLNSLQRALRDGSEFEIEARLVEDSGEVLWIVNRGQVFQEQGRPTHVSGIMLDITTRKHNEELLQRSEKLAMIGRLAASIAHEINNPLESVTNLLYLIEHHPELDEAVRGYARLASEELGRVSHISRQTLGFYRESASPMPANLAELLNDVIRLYERKLERKRVRVERDYRLAGEVLVYPAEVRQVFSNLLMNALEASPEGGAIRIRLAPAVSWRGKQVRGVRIVVADQGHGIAPQNRRRIFEPFFTTKGEKGTGLGLWVSNGLVQKHGGSIHVRSNTSAERHGTVFSLFIPDAERMPVAQSGAAAE